MKNYNSVKEKMRKLKKKSSVACHIATISAVRQMRDSPTIMGSVGIGLAHGLKYNGDFKRGVKAGLITYGVVVGANVVVNVTNNWYMIKNT